MEICCNALPFLLSQVPIWRFRWYNYHHTNSGDRLLNCKVCICATLRIGSFQPHDALCALTTCQLPLLCLCHPHASPHLKAAAPVVSADRPRLIGQHHKCAPQQLFRLHHIQHMQEPPLLGRALAGWRRNSPAFVHFLLSSFALGSRPALIYLATNQQMSPRRPVHTYTHMHTCALSLSLDSPVAYLCHI